MHPLSGYLDCSATTPVAEAVLQEMAAVQASAWANPSSLHGFGWAAAEQLERSRHQLAELLGCRDGQVVFTSGGTESIHLALLGAMAELSPSTPARLLISSVEHPATLAAADQLLRRGWQVDAIPVDRCGVVDLNRLEQLLAPPTRLVSLIWGQSEVGTLQPITAIGRLCQQADVLLHLDAVQVVGRCPIQFDALPVDLLSLGGHKVQGPRGIGALLVREGLALQPCLGGGGQEAGLRAGTEPVALVAGLVKALELALSPRPDVDPIDNLRTALLERLVALPGVSLTGPDPRQPQAPGRLPHHLSLVVRDRAGAWLNGRRLVQALWQQGFACSSGSACSSGQTAPSAVLQAMGYDPAAAASGLRISLGGWHTAELLNSFPPAFERARAAL
ncbi:MAG: cysteine desulfurase [Cyanobacteria bacterium M_surface_10_m2_179]|nr:cysteine desulfurase [Cyanobacteria bacterium M_surface_10_m2_179]